MQGFGTNQAQLPAAQSNVHAVDEQTNVTMTRIYQFRAKMPMQWHILRRHFRMHTHNCWI